LQLGIVATHAAAGPELVGLASAAARRGWGCRCFLTDRGVLLLRSPEVIELARSGAMRLDACHLSWERFAEGAIPEGAHAGSQYNNAELAHACDRVVVL
jgi:hypothetical protein